MNVKTIRERLLAGTMIGGVALATAIALPVAAVVIAPTTASAQDYTTGALAGNVVDASGSAIAGATVEITSNEQSFTRTTTTGANGTFRFTLIPQGTYEVRITADGFSTSLDPSVAVRVGGTSSYTINLTESTEVSEVVVTAGRAQLDFTQTTKGQTFNVSEMVERLPIGRTVNAITLLAPGVVEGDSAFGTTPSLGGASVAENAFYVNGLNITNFNNYIGGATVPFEFYRTVDVQTGGYAAEFGRATGGIINATTKSGTNDFVFELHGNYAPNSLRESSPNVVNRAGVVTGRNDMTQSESWSIIAEAGGPIIKDRLYAYGLYQWSTSDVTTVATTDIATTTLNEIPLWGGKIDAYITDNQHLEFTYFNTEGEYSPRQYNYLTGAASGGNNTYVGGENWVARYTGKFTDWLTLSAAYGVNQDRSYSEPLDATSRYVADYRLDDRGTGPAFRVPGSNASSSTSYMATERKFYRVDADLLFNWKGDHHVRFGMDNEDTKLNRFTERTGGYSIYYYAGDDWLAPAAQDILNVYTVNMGSGGADIKGNNQAFYIQDSWDVTEHLNVQVGLRHDKFALDNLAGENVISLDGNWGPRLAFSLDPFGNKQDKFFASYGKYFIPVASNLSFRGADLFYDAYFENGGTYSYGVNGEPVGGLGNPIVNPDLQLCPNGTPGGAAGLRSCLVYGDGSAEPADAKYAQGTEATSEDEIIIGYERRLNDLWRVGAAVTYRRLNKVSEDIAVDYLVRKYCDENLPGDKNVESTLLGQCYTQFYGDHQYIIANIGEDLTFLAREALPDGSRPTMTFSAAEVGMPKPKREYTGLEVTFDRKFDGKWSLNGSYTLSKSIGNYEGTVLSDNGQTDAGSTILYDHIGLTQGKYGLLPNHRAHQFKLFGSYQVLDGLTIGANYTLTSGRHFGCLSRAATDELSYGYGAASGVCRPDVLALVGNNKPFVSGIGTTDYGDYVVTTPRGSVFQGDWTQSLDLSVRYELPTFGFMPKGVVLRADVFNVFNFDTGTDFNETGTSGTTITANQNYSLASGFQTPRYVRFGFDMKF